jgi:transcriptional regulator with PAS, ATPase and Fis domain
MPLHLPPLRQRRDDIPLLVDHFVAHYNTLYRKNVSTVAPDALAVLMTHGYPGNIRELENILQHAFVLCQGTTIMKKHLPEYLLHPEPPAESAPAVESDSWESFEKRRIVDALERNRYSRTKAAKELGIHTATLWRKMKKLGIEA